MTAAVRRVVLFAREPVPGRVKTRLARRIGDGPAAALYSAFLEDLAGALPCPERWDAALAHAEPEAGPFLRRTFRPPWSFVPQGEGSLGERLIRVFESERNPGKSLSGDAPGVLVAGSDAPTLSKADLEAAFRALEDGAEVVFAPSHDGGFSLIGVGGAGEKKKTERQGDFLEGVRWSTADALEDARRAAERLGRRVVLLAPVPDVDGVADLVPLLSYLSKNRNSAPATRRVIESHLGRVVA